MAGIGGILKELIEKIKQLNKYDYNYDVKRITDMDDGCYLDEEEVIEFIKSYSQWRRYPEEQPKEEGWYVVCFVGQLQDLEPRGARWDGKEFQFYTHVIRGHTAHNSRIKYFQKWHPPKG